MEWFSEETAHELHELRCLHELARQLLPLRDRYEVARDGLLCIAGITGIGAGAVFWRSGQEPLRLLSHFGVHHQYEAAVVDPEAERFLVSEGATTIETCRRRAAGRALLQALGALPSEIADAWVLPLSQEAQLRGVLLLGPSLVTGELLPDTALLADLAETLRLALVGADAPAIEQPVGGDSTSAKQQAWQQAAPVSQRLSALHSQYPETRNLVGESDAILAVLEEVVTLAETDYTVMVHGGTGTGKEMAASMLHGLSRRSGGPFEAVDCSSIPQELIESELFGHVKGAFTGATRDFKGAFERADGGTLLLDEIGDMDLRSQTRLLRVLQEGKVRPLGGDRPVSVDVRVVAATNRDLAEMVRAGTFREDLYYRIHVCLLSIPALKDRGADRIVLYDHFMHLHAEEIGRAARPLSTEARQRLMQEDFPGNVRQLQNVVRQLLVQSVGETAVSLEELDRVLQRSTLSPSLPLASAALPQAMGSSGAQRGAEMKAERSEAVASVDDVGGWVVEQLRQHRFNLSAAAKGLSALRASGQHRQAVPVFDRGALDYYLCGEFYERLLQRQFDSEAAIRDLAGEDALTPRLRRKVRAFLRPLETDIRGDVSAEELKSLMDVRFSRVPDRYRAALFAVLEAVRDGEWNPTQVDLS